MKKEYRRSRFGEKLMRRPVLAGILTFAFFLLIGSFVLWQRYRILKKDQQREISNIINLVEQNIELSLKNTYSAALSLALIINDEGEIEQFDRIAPQIVDSNPNIDAVQLVPGGVITHIYPREGNLVAFNYNILADTARSAEAKKAIAEKRMYFAGPLRLKQGGMAVVGRLPVFVKNEFWGFSAIIIRFENLLHQSGIDQLGGEKYRFQFGKIDPETGRENFFLPDFTEVQRAYSEKVILPDGDWYLYVAPQDANKVLYSLFPFALFILLISVWFGWAMTRLIRKPSRLQRLVEIQEGELYQSENKFRTIFHQASIGMALTESKSGRILEANKRFRKLLGYDEGELRGKKYAEFTHPDDLNEDEAQMHRLIRGEIKDYSLQKRVIRKSGEIAWVKLTVSPLWNEGDEVDNHIAFVEDITEVKTAEMDLNNSYKMVLEQNRRLLNFSYIISHDLRSHSSNIQAILNLYRNTKASEEKEHYVQLLTKVSGALDQTLRDLNEVVSIQTNVNLNVEPLPVLNYLRQTLDLLDVEIKREKAKIDLAVPEEMMVTFNPAYMQSILLNFLSNALRYSDPERYPQIRIHGWRNNGHWILEFADNGIGIDLDRHGKKLFGLYKTFSKNGESRGVGLFITKNQIEAMGGKVEVESEPGRGSKFRVVFK